MDRKINSSNFPLTRNRRLRNLSWLRSQISETKLSLNDLVLPIFLKEESDNEILIPNMPGIKRFSPKELLNEIDEITKLGIQSIAIFPKVPKELKSKNAHEAINPNNLVCRTMKTLRHSFPELGIICDVALDPYTLDGHDGITDESGKVDNDITVEILAKMSINLAASGCQIVAPSDMMDGRIKLIRDKLEKNKFTDVLILSYSAKFCSNFYGPFRNALGSNSLTKEISKETYQLSFNNRLEAIKTTESDIIEGADIVMVKPAGYYLDVIREIRAITYLPISAFQVSGEYSMIKYSAKQNVFDYEKTVLESLNCIKRSGADIIFSYFSKEVAKWLS